MGVPQGSPLSPILFLFYAAPLLKNINDGVWSERRVGFAFVDDTNIIITGPSAQHNCQVFGRIHEEIKRTCGDALQFEFSPEKYTVFHFVKPRTRNPDSQEFQALPELPEWAGISEADRKKRFLRKTLRVLGVWVDRHLTFKPHIEKIWMRIRASLANHERYGGATWGASVLANREFYQKKLYTYFSYAAAGWFIYDLDQDHEVKHECSDDSPDRTLKFGMAKSTIERLRAIQSNITLTISGQMRGIKVAPILAELHIHDLALQLYAQAMKYRCKYIGSPFYDLLHEQRRYTDKKGSITHKDWTAVLPYEKLEQRAWAFVEAVLESPQAEYLRNAEGIQFTETMTLREKVNMVRERQPALFEETLKNYFNQWLLNASSARWEEYKRERCQQGKPLHLAHKEDFTNHTLSYYAPLNRPQSTIALNIRIGHIPLASNPMWRQMNAITDPLCRYCRRNGEDAEHLFFHCKALEIPRRFLLDETGPVRFDELMTTHIDIATKWAIQYFPLDMYKNIRKKDMYQFPLKKCMYS